MKGESRLTKRELEERLQQAVDFGNEMAEELEGMRKDDVIAAYRRVVREASIPSAWVQAGPDPLDDLLDDEGRWDCFVGELQRAGVVDKELMSADPKLRNIIGEDDS